jgi:hypothetical protein
MQLPLTRHEHQPRLTLTCLFTPSVTCRSHSPTPLPTTIQTVLPSTTSSSHPEDSSVSSIPSPSPSSSYRLSPFRSWSSFLEMCGKTSREAGLISGAGVEELSAGIACLSRTSRRGLTRSLTRCPGPSLYHGEDRSRQLSSTSFWLRLEAARLP